MRKTFAALTLASACICVCTAAYNGSKADDSDEPKNKASFWMEQKLEFAQNILSGLTRGDFDEIHKNATAMKGLNKVEFFVRRDPPEYRTQLKVFQYATSELIRHAEDSNLDGATLAYAQLTISCVNCHKQLRE